MRTYSDDDLVTAVSTQRSWRGVLRELGLAATSAAAMRSVRLRADRLGLSYTHFTGQRRWTDSELVAAVADSNSWAEVADALGLSGGSSTATLKGHAVRLGIDTSHMTRSGAEPVAPTPGPNRANISRAGSMLAAAWFELAGASVAWPLEPARYDLLVAYQQRLQRIQVKTTITKEGSSYVVFISNSGRERRTYDPDEVDQFFVIDGDLNFYLIPISVVGGLTALRLTAYQGYRLPPL